MHGLPPNFDYSPFVGRELESVNFALRMVHFSFGEEYSATSWHEYSYMSAPGCPLTTETVEQTVSNVMILLRARIRAVDPGSDGTLRFVFEDSRELRIHESEAPYESYDFHLGGQRVIV
jgi:hypothetical protein